LIKTIYSDGHALHDPVHEVDCGKVVDCAEKPSRADTVYKSILSNHLGPIIKPETYDIQKILNIHSGDYVDFLRSGYLEWKDAGLADDVFATNFNMQRMCSLPPQSIIGKAGYYLSDTSVSITKGTWDGIKQSADVALTALDYIVKGDRCAFALTRPPGHHASVSIGAGYGFLNYVAITAQEWISRGLGKVAVLDVDYHHGNGTQDIFYRRSDVLYCSLHADPAFDFPYFSGYADEKGEGDGENYNFNYPLALGTDWDVYKTALQHAVDRVHSYSPDLLIVSLGVDTFIEDPISKFRLQTPDYLEMGRQIAKLKKPTLFIMEGGYAIDKIGINIVNVLRGFLDNQAGSS
jgi:acetoin utilization deacetylase AcuC-like enzyme